MGALEHFKILGLLRWFGRTLLAGLGAVLPLIITLYLIGWLASIAETFLSGIIKLVLPGGEGDGPHPYYVPGMGITLLIVLLLCIGASLRTYFMRQAIEWEDRLMRNIPFIRSLYTSIKDVAQYFGQSREKNMGQTCVVTLPGTSIQLMGFITRRDVSDFDGTHLVDKPLMVYLPMSYQIGGYLLVVPENAVQPLDVPFDDALSYIFMAGMTGLNHDTDSTAQSGQQARKQEREQEHKPLPDQPQPEHSPAGATDDGT